MNKKTLSNLIAPGKGFTTEFKQAGTSNLGRDICAFANATGGVILIGVTDAGKIVGVKDHNRLKSEVHSAARSAEPPIAVDVESIDDVQEATSDTTQVGKVISVLEGEQSRGELMASLDLKNRMHFVKEYLQPSLEGGWIERTLPDKPNSRNQKYRLTEAGKSFKNKV